MEGPGSKLQIPNEWFCPITQEVMRDPVIGSDGYTYERKAIVEWLQNHHDSPVTRVYMEGKNLIPNMALRSTIQQMLPEYQKQGVQLKKKPAPRVEANIKAGELKLEADSMVLGEHLYVNLSVVPPVQPPKTGRKKCAIVCAIDVSGSMDTEATIKNGKDVQAHGFTRLDLVKHSLNTIINCLGEGDYLALIPFANRAKIGLQLTEMTEKNKKIAEKTVKDMKANGSTNIWDGIRISMDVSKKEICEGLNTYIILLTDGEPNMNPPQGIIPTFRKYIGQEGLHSNVHVFGYGYQLDTVLLTQIASEGIGTYAYIPDCSMVGTIFVNFLSNSLATVTNQATLTLEPAEGNSVVKVYGLEEPKLVIPIGGIQYGQNRDTLVQMSLPSNGADFLKVTLNYGPNLVLSTSIALKELGPRNANYLQSQINRGYHIEGLRTALKSSAHLKEGLQIVKNTLKELRSSPVAGTDPLTKLLIKENMQSEDENEGQVMKVFEKQEWFDKWGKHYIPSLLRAHYLQVCTNFKDPGLQSYGGKLFQSLQNDIDTVFIKLPAPEPTIKKEEYVAPVNMARYYNFGGGCIAGHCRVSMADGSVKTVRAVSKGDKILDGNNKVHSVLCVLKTKVAKTIDMVHFPSGLVITPFHPVKINGVWKFPTEVSQTIKSFVAEYFNFVLEDGHSMVVDGLECITLAHGLKDNAVTSHDYLGTSAILDDLKQMTGWQRGLVEVGGFERDPASLRITKLMAGEPSSVFA